MMLKDKMSVISASGRPTAKLNPFLESSFRGHCTVADAVLVEVMNVSRTSEQFTEELICFLKEVNGQLLLASTCHWSSHRIKKYLARISSCPFYDFREKFQVMESNEVAIRSTLRCADALENRKNVEKVEILGYFVPVVVLYSQLN